MKNTNNLGRLLEELLKEAQPIERPTSMADFAPNESKPISLDQAIDRYLTQYERESIPTSEMFENKNIKNLIGFLLEQDLDEPSDDEEDVGLEPIDDETVPGLEPGPGVDALGGDLDLGAEKPEGGSDPSSATKPVINTPQLNLQDFTRSIARLVNNAQSLIDFQSLILNRAEAYIKNNYDERTAQELMSILDNQWDLRPETAETLSNKETEFPQPHTAVTGPMGG